jgi:hypothetical protein
MYFSAEMMLPDMDAFNVPGQGAYDWLLLACETLL